MWEYLHLIYVVLSLMPLWSRTFHSTLWWFDPTVPGQLQYFLMTLSTKNTEDNNQLLQIWMHCNYVPAQQSTTTFIMTMSSSGFSHKCTNYESYFDTYDCTLVGHQAVILIEEGRCFLWVHIVSHNLFAAMEKQNVFLPDEHTLFWLSLCTVLTNSRRKLLVT